MTLQLFYRKDRRNTFAKICVTAISTFVFSSGSLPAQSTSEPQASAPANMAIVTNGRGGAWYVAKGLKEEFDKLLERTQSLQKEVDQKIVPAAEARQQIVELRARLETLRTKMESQKQFVSPFNVHTKNETLTFDLGPQKLLVITADNVVVKGWNEPHVKCELEKVVLTSGDQPADAHLAEMKLRHQHGLAPEIVGLTDAEHEAKEQEFLASPDGQKLTPEQRESRTRFRLQAIDYRSHYTELQGRELDQVSIDGIGFQQNTSLTFKVDSEGGTGMGGSVRQRHAKLTVFVPRANHIVLRGCLVNLNATGLESSLTVTSEESFDRAYDGVFSIKGIHGLVSVRNSPIDEVMDVVGNVSLVSTIEFVDSGTHYENDQRTVFFPNPRTTHCQNIEGDLTAWFSRANLSLNNITGLIDVRNEFGDTSLTVLNPMSDGSHRIVSESGRIDFVIRRKLLEGTAFNAFTSVGTLIANATRDLLEEGHFNTPSEYYRSRRDWRCFRTFKPEARFVSWTTFHRPDEVLSNAARTPGLDLISRAGKVTVNVRD